MILSPLMFSITMVMIISLSVILLRYIQIKLIWKIIWSLSIIAISLVSWLSFIEQQGWPYKAAMPEKSILIASMISEPHGDDEGKIYLWINTETDKTPRAIQIPYDREVHKQLTQKKRQNGNKEQGIIVNSINLNKNVIGKYRYKKRWLSFDIPPKPKYIEK
ncbi:MAG: hypothetical protein WC284_04400 [Candidimonas sp.]